MVTLNTKEKRNDYLATFMICPNCGIRLASGLNKCHFCGHLLLSKEMEISKEEKEDLSFKGEELYLDKFIALFTIFAFAIASGAIFYEIFGKDYERTLSWVVSGGFGFLIAGLYAYFSPWGIRYIIDPLLSRRNR